MFRRRYHLTWMILKAIVLSGINWVEKDKYRTVIYMCNLKITDSQKCRVEGWLPERRGCRKLGVGGIPGKVYKLCCKMNKF